jgi:hypothetical protein
LRRETAEVREVEETNAPLPLPRQFAAGFDKSGADGTLLLRGIGVAVA